nr:hypothetical protein [Pseudonocardia sp. AL041005-10]
MPRPRFETMAQLQRIALSKTVPCPFPPCSQPVGERCVNTSSTTSKGAPLGGLGAHVPRLDAAEAHQYPALPVQSSPADREPVPA